MTIPYVRKETVNSFKLIITAPNAHPHEVCNPMKTRTIVVFAFIVADCKLLGKDSLQRGIVKRYLDDMQIPHLAKHGPCHWRLES